MLHPAPQTWWPFGWRQRVSPRRTVITGWDGGVAMVVTVVVLTLFGQALFAWRWGSPFASAWAFARALAWLLGGSAAAVAALRWRVVVDAEGLRCARSWCGVPYRFRRFPRGSRVDAVDDPWDAPDWWWVEIRRGFQGFVQTVSHPGAVCTAAPTSCTYPVVERGTVYLPSPLRAWFDALLAEPRAKTVYKPALLLAVLDLLDEGLTEPSRVAPDEALAGAVDAMLKEAKVSAPPGVAWKPFFHLGTVKAERRPIWTLHDHGGAPLRVTAEDAPSSLRDLRTRVAFAAFAPDLAAPLHTAAERTLIRRLVYEWLERRRDADAIGLLKAHDRDWALVEKSQSLLREALGRPFELHVQRSRVELPERTVRARDRAFRLEVVPLYEHRCAACTLRLRWGDLYEAEAAHIVPVSADGADDVRNALTLCRTHHWAFDAGLWTVDASRHIVVIDAPAREDVDLKALRTLHGRALRSPPDATSAPHPDALAWHREHWSRRGPRAA